MLPTSHYCKKLQLSLNSVQLPKKVSFYPVVLAQWLSVVAVNILTLTVYYILRMQ